MVSQGTREKLGECEKAIELLTSLAWQMELPVVFVGRLANPSLANLAISSFWETSLTSEHRDILKGDRGRLGRDLQVTPVDTLILVGKVG